MQTMVHEKNPENQDLYQECETELDSPPQPGEFDYTNQAPVNKSGEVPGFLANENLRLIIFGGKGGTGKTTSSCATATCLAHLQPEKRFLVVSSDPAHSLADSLDCSVNASPTPVTGLENLRAIEMDPLGMLEKFKKKYSNHLENLSGMAYSSDQIDIRDFLTFKLPGMEEMMILLELVRLLRFGIFRKWEYDKIIWDTAPTGHTLRLLELPAKLLEWISIFKMTSKRHRVIATGAASLGFKIKERRPPQGNVNSFIEMLSHELEQLLQILKDPQQCEFVPVTIPETMGILETGKLIDALQDQEISVKSIIVNRIASRQDCPFCTDREKDHINGLADIHSRFSPYNIVPVQVFSHEVRGETMLMNYSSSLLGKTVATEIEQQGVKVQIQTPALENSKQNSSLNGSMVKLLEKEFRFLIFGGKGGVGKTTVSASTALALAMRNPDKRILVFSTDPAHSLSDSFDQQIGDRITEVEGVENLHALEADGTQLYQTFRDDYKKNIKKAFQLWKGRNLVSTRKWKLDFDEDVMSKFVDTYPPGLEEVLALEKIMESVNNHEYDVYVFDTAPTGHLIQLLQFPELVREWLQTTYRAILKHHREHPVDELDIIAKRIILSQNTVDKMKTLLTDPQISEFVAVTIAEAMGMLETEDLTASIKQLGIPNNHIVVNMIIPPTDCGFCSVKSTEQQYHLETLKQQLNGTDHNVVSVPLFPYQICGKQRLNEIVDVLYHHALEVHYQAEQRTVKTLINHWIAGLLKFIHILKPEKA